MFASATPPPALVVAVSPAKAGTAAKPRPVQVQLAISGAANASRVVVYFPKALRISNTGLPQCTVSDARILAGECTASVAGSGAAMAGSGPFQMTPLVSPTGLLFRVTGASQKAVLHGAFGRASGQYAAKLQIALPGFLRQLSQLSFTMKLTHRAGSLFATRGCSGGKLPFRVDLRGSSTASLHASASCR